jgi:putative tryptophan/tyrosine transport system substrate-binding protein
MLLAGERLQMQFDRLKRRKFITLLGGAAAAWPLVARADQKLSTIGWLGSGSAIAASPWVTAFGQRLRELGRIEGRTVAIEYRWAEGRDQRFAEIMAEFIRLKVDVVLTYSNAAALAAKQATTSVPIVFAAAGDPVGTGLVASLARPGGNLTGLSIQQTDLAGKRLEILREIVPRLRTLAILANARSPNAVLEMGEAQAAAHLLGVDVILSQVRVADDIALAIETLKDRADAIYTCSDPLLTTNRIRVNTLALRARLPTVHGFREYAESGGLVSYGPNFPDLFRRAAEFVEKILRGTQPADLPVEQPTKFDLVVNLKTAKALSLSLSPTLLARADEVIE